MQPHSATFPSPPTFATRSNVLQLGLLLLLTGTGKLFAPSAFAASVAAYDSLPSKIVVVAALVIIAEVALGGALLIGYRTRLISLLAATLLCVFTPTTSPTRRGQSLRCLIPLTTMARTHL